MWIYGLLRGGIARSEQAVDSGRIWRGKQNRNGLFLARFGLGRGGLKLGDCASAPCMAAGIPWHGTTKRRRKEV